VLVQRSGAALGKDAPGDELAITESWPLPPLTIRDLNLTSRPNCPFPGPSPTPTPLPLRDGGP